MQASRDGGFFAEQLKTLLKQMKFYLTFLALVLLANTGFTQTGTISGTITEQSNGQPIIGAVIIVDSLKPVKGTVSDFDGNYALKLAPGVYSLSCRYTGFSPVTITGVTVAAGKTTPLDFSLSVTLDSVIIIYDTRPTRSTSAVLDTIHHGNTVAVGKSGDEIRETPATDAGQVARTLPGVTLVDNRFVIVRGLSERYNAVLLNNVLAPSVESDVKAFSFDLIPSAMIDNFMIYKSASPDLPGEFAGGVIRVNTTEIPDNNGLQVNYQAGYRNGTTFQPFSMNGGTTADLFAYGSKSRQLPDGFPANLRPLMASGDAQALQDAGRSLNANWGYTTRNAPADVRFNATWNYKYSKPGGNGRNGFQFGNITGLSYSNAYSAFTSYRLDYNVYDTINGHSDTLFSYEDAVYRQAVRVAFVQNNTVRFGKGGNQRITLKNLFNQMGDNETILRTGKNMDESNYRQEYSYRYTQRSIYTAQLGGLHLFNNKNTQLN